MSKGIVAGVLVLLMVGGVAGYYAYTSYLPGRVVLSITDPPVEASPGPSQYSSNISHIYLTFTEIDLHAAGVGNLSNVGWRTIASAETVDLLTVLDKSQTLSTTKLSTGKYDLIRMIASTVTVEISGTNYSYNIPSGKVQLIITGGGFEITVGQTVNLKLTISFNENEIMAHGPNLSPVAKAEVLS